VTKLKKIWLANRLFFIVIATMFVFRSAIADWNSVPTGSMLPTIVEGDRILVNKVAYDIRVPFTHISLYELGNPERGDIVVFDSHVFDERLVKRVIGIPGDIVEMHNNKLRINGKPLNYADKADGLMSKVEIENLFGVQHDIKINSSIVGQRSSFSPIQVPEHSYLVLGDNRDNSADSRVIGFVPRNEIIGRAKTVVMSLDYDNYYIPRSDRFLHDL
jgi:signal peptidase I